MDSFKRKLHRLNTKNKPQTHRYQLLMLRKYCNNITITFSRNCNCRRSSGWNNPDGIKCAMETTPVLNTSMPLDVGTDWQMFAIAANVTRSMKVPIYFLNITTLSEYRKDAHASVYTIRQGKMLTLEQKADPLTYADCIHWCLPGLPDTWNELLYARIASHW